MAKCVSEIRHSHGISIFKLFINSYPSARSTVIAILLRNSGFHFLSALLPSLVYFLLPFFARFPSCTACSPSLFYFLGSCFEFGHFQVAFCLCVETNLIAEHSYENAFPYGFIFMQIKLRRLVLKENAEVAYSIVFSRHEISAFISRKGNDRRLKPWPNESQVDAS